MHALSAAVPPGLALVLLLARVRPVHAAVLSLLSAVVVAALAFPVSGLQLVSSLGRVGPTCLEVALILLGGVLLNEFMTTSGASDQLADWLAGTCRVTARAVVLIALGVTPFAESVTGFGVGVVVAVPLLCRLHLSPTRAAIVGLLGLVTVPWGALGPGTLVAAQFTGIDLQQLGMLSAVLSAPLYLIAGAAALVVAVGARQAVVALPELLTAVVVLAVGVWSVNATLGVPLAGALGSVASLLATLLVVSVRERRRPEVGHAVWLSMTPYACLMALLLGTRLLSVAGLTLPAGLSSPAVWLLGTCALTPLLLRIAAKEQRSAVSAAAARWWPVAATTVMFLLLGALLTVTGMSAELARSAARLGDGYLLLAPFIGALGGFLTGSNTGSNAMFVSGQALAAHSIGANATLVVAAQNVSASLATMASPARIALATNLAGPVAATETGSVLRTVLAVDLVGLAVVALVIASSA